MATECIYNIYIYIYKDINKKTVLKMFDFEFV